MAKHSKSPLVERELSLENKSGYQLTEEESDQYGRILKRIVRARNQRELPRDEFDNLSYEQVYLANRRASHSYLTPKRNDDEVRIATGTTEKRLEVVLNELLGLNLGEEIRAFDKDDNLLKDVSETFTDIVKRTEQIEQADDKDIFIYQELITQPSVFVEELFLERKNIRGKKNFSVNRRCDRRMIQGVQMYLGDINLPDIRFNDQPFLIKYARMTMEEGEQSLRALNPKRWDDNVTPGPYTNLITTAPRLYRKGSLMKDEIEAFWYMSYPDNEVQVVVNGIPMLDVGEQYTKIFGDFGGYHITMIGLKPYSGDFAYSKPLTQSAKTLQALDNEMIRNLVRKFRQALEPPLGVPEGKVYSRDIWNPGAMVQGVKAKNFEKLIDHQGVTQGEMAMFDLIEKKTNEFIGTSQQEPLQGKTKVTATELQLAQKQAIKLLGLAVLACMRLKERLAMLRVKNVLNNYMKPVGRKVDPISGEVNKIFARFSLDEAEIDGQLGRKTIQFMDRGLTEEEQFSTFAAEERAKEEGKPFQFKVVNISALNKLELNFYAVVTAKERESSQLDKVMLTDMLNQAAGITGMTGIPVKGDKITEKFERVWKEKDLFQKEPPQSLNPQQAQAGNVIGSPEGGNIRTEPRAGLINQPPSPADIF